MDQDDLIPKGVWTLDGVKAYAIGKGICPYFAVRRMVSNPVALSRSLFINDIAAQFTHVSVIIYSFHYLLDPKIAELVSKEISKEAIVVFDEAHNIGPSFYSSSLDVR